MGVNVLYGTLSRYVVQGVPLRNGVGGRDVGSKMETKRSRLIQPTTRKEQVCSWWHS